MKRKSSPVKVGQALSPANSSHIADYFTHPMGAFASD
jgi:hypothetical protein